MFPAGPGLRLPSDGHDHADDDRGCHDDAKQVVKDERTCVGPGDNICDQGVYPICNQYHYWGGLYLLLPAYYSVSVSGLSGTLSRSPDNIDSNRTLSASSAVIRCSS